MASYRTSDGDVLDAICFGHYGREGVAPEVLAANPGLAGMGAVYDAGLTIALPELPAADTEPTLRLWM